MTARNLSGETTSQMLVHSLAISAALSLIDQGTSRQQTTTRTNRSGDQFDVDFAVITFGLLTDLVGNALALSTLKGIVSKHPSLHVMTNRVQPDSALRVDLASRKVS
jgi:hypothetical protein